ncbi:copper chaperone [Clostridium sp. CAG:149]|nr:copper chaperone [Clostridium sp. CAG:149]
MSGGTISTAVICVILAVICIFSVKKYRKKLTSGCCGAGGEGTVKKRRVSDRNKAHYPYTKILKIDGMSCGNCANRVENALNALDGVWASVDLGSQEALVRMKQPTDPEFLKNAVRKQGYTVIRITD